MRHRFCIIWGVLGCAVIATPSLAQQVQTFTYDVQGRLVGTNRTTGSATQTTAYGLDNADNRTSKVVSSASGGGGMAAAGNEKPVRVATLKALPSVNKHSR